MVGGNVASPAVSQVVVEIGNCSGVLIGRKIVLTNAHCISESLENVAVSGKNVHVVGCTPHPFYVADQASHDLGICRLATPSASWVPFDDVPLSAGSNVLLAGYGLPSPFSRERPHVLRVVHTSVFAVRSDVATIGTNDHTACRGDSGGPVLVDHGGVLHVAGVIHGPSDAICASPAEAVSVSANRAWLQQMVDGPRDAAPGNAAGVRLIIALTVLGVVALLFLARRARAGN
jgi:secreted trypsin-like serine protease